MCSHCDQSSANQPTKPRISARVSRRQALGAPLMAMAVFTLGAKTSSAQEAEKTPFGTPMPANHDACPVCGMFPGRYPDWIATVEYGDGHADHFDGAKDMFKYLLDMKKFASGRKAEDIVRIGVTDYYATERIDARTAYYVIGSDVLGPMGHDLIPHPDEYDMKEFSKDHFGKRILRFDEVTMDMLLALDRGEFLLD